MAFSGKDFDNTDIDAFFSHQSHRHCFTGDAISTQRKREREREEGTGEDINHMQVQPATVLITITPQLCRYTATPLGRQV